MKVYFQDPESEKWYCLIGDFDGTESTYFADFEECEKPTSGPMYILPLNYVSFVSKFIKVRSSKKNLTLVVGGTFSAFFKRKLIKDFTTWARLYSIPKKHGAAASVLIDFQIQKLAVGLNADNFNIKPKNFRK